MDRAWIAIAVGVASAACTVHDNGGGFDSLGQGSSEGADSLLTTGITSTTGSDASSGNAGSESTSSEPKYDLANFDVGMGGVDESTCAAVELSHSSAGCLFAPFVGGSSPEYPWAVVAANAGSNTANVTLTSKDGVELEAAVIAPGETHTFVLAGESQAIYDHRQLERTQITKSAMILESDAPISAYQFYPFSFSENASADAALMLPVHAWDDAYYLGHYANDGQPWMIVISLEDDNEVTITAPDNFTGNTLAGDDLVPLIAGQPQQVTLNAQEILKIRDGDSTDFTGFRVQSTKPVAVSVGAPTMSIPGPSSLEFRDYLEEQVPPLSSWGTRYVAAKFHDRGGEPDVYRFIGSEDGTTITLTGGVNDEITLDEGEFVDVMTPASFFADGDEPFLVEHLMVSQQLTDGPKNEAEYPGEGQSNNCWGDGSTSFVGDPAITFLTAVNQFRTDYTFLTPTTFAWDFLTVVALADEWDLVELDGAPLPADPTPIGASGYAFASFRIEDGPHVIHGDAEVGIEVYGYDCVVSYAYAGGLSLAKINPAG